MIAEAATLKEVLSPERYEEFDRLMIAGEWRTGRSEQVNLDRNPYTGETLVEIREASREDLDESYEAAATTQKAWSALLPGQRAEVMRRAASVMEVRQEEIISWLIREAGSTRIKATLEWKAVHAVLLESATLPYLVEGRILPVDAKGKESRVYRKAVGVVGVISPWNWPLQLTAQSIFPALAVGNAVVLKPASDTPVTGGLLHARILEEAGLPSGVFSVVVGAGKEIGDAFVAHPIPRVISFTGSRPVGRHIARLATEALILKRIDLKLGGNSAFVVLDDANLEQAIDAAVFGKFLHQGQDGVITNRFVVDDSVYDEFVDGFAVRVRNLKLGDPDQPDTVIGPIINKTQLDGLKMRIQEAKNSGARQVVGGEIHGLILPPHVFAEVLNSYPIAREELFGPVAPIIRARGEEDALRIANDTSHDLSSTVFTADLERGLNFAQQIEAGMTHINDQSINDLAFNDRWAIEAFTNNHWITIQHTRRHYPADARELRGPWGGE